MKTSLNRELGDAASPLSITPHALCRDRLLPLPLAHRSQRGATLVVALIFLLLLTIIGVTAVTTSTLQQKMAANLKDKQISFYGAESALRHAEAWIAQQPGRISVMSSLPCNGVVCDWGVAGDFTDLATHTTAWWTGGNATADPDNITAPTGLQPQYIIEQQSFTPQGYKMGGQRFYTIDYSITSTAWGATQNAVTTLQETYAKLVP